MGTVLEGLRGAWDLLARGDRETYSIAWLSLRVSLGSILAASLLGVPAGVWLGLHEFRGKAFVRGLLNALFSLPTVVVGLFFFSLLGRRGPLGGLGLLYTPWAMMLGQLVLAAPIIAALTLAAVEGADRRVVATARTLGATPAQARRAVVFETGPGILAAVMAGFGRVFAEVGVSMMLGGNIRGATRTLTTGIALQTSKGEFELGMALGIVLLAIALGVNVAGQVLRPRGWGMRGGGRGGGR